MNYALLLRKYIAVIMTNEGSAFVRWCKEDGNFTEEEIAEIDRIEDEIIAES